MKNSFSIVVSSFGNNCDPYIDALKNSVKLIYPKVDISIIGKDVPANEDLINDLRNKHNFVKVSPGSLKIICWNQGFKEAKTDWVSFLDNDTLLLKSLEKYFDLAEKTNSDFIFTWRNSIPQWVNSGVMLVRKNKKTIKFFEEYERNMIQDIANNQNDQYSFINLLNRSSSQTKKIVNSTRKKYFYFLEKDINFLAVHCDYLNRSSPKLDWFDETCIQHLKGIQCTIITKNKKQNRYEDFIKRDIFYLSKKEIKNLNYRINLWKKFANNEYSKNVIDLEEFVKQ